ncbi:hypothetical protein V1517DRAFT_319666 [Lipomyces orientalis]|uniref:Uncharacterized protein n=1 Tax=Lipomyces orientalis TaxID=1233043 RepID=A0ACC3TRU3_9ASCO
MILMVVGILAWSIATPVSSLVWMTCMSTFKSILSTKRIIFHRLAIVLLLLARARLC